MVLMDCWFLRMTEKSLYTLRLTFFVMTSYARAWGRRPLSVQPNGIIWICLHNDMKRLMRKRCTGEFRHSKNASLSMQSQLL